MKLIVLFYSVLLMCASCEPVYAGIKEEDEKVKRELAKLVNTITICEEKCYEVPRFPEEDEESYLNDSSGNLEQMEDSLRWPTPQRMNP